MGSRVTETFKEELDLISSKQLREFVERCFDKICPPSFWTAPASVTGKYHPSFANKKKGLVYHVKYSIWWALQLINAFPPLHPSAEDEIICALLLHDLFKQENPFTGEKLKKAVHTHGVLAAMRIVEVEKELSEEQERILAAIAGHMGKWTEPSSFMCWNIRDEKTRNVAVIVHLADYAASRRTEDFVESISSSTEEKKKVEFSNGKVLEKVYPEESLPYQFSSTLFELVVARQPNYYRRYLEREDGQEYFIQKEAYYFDLLLRKDKKPPEEVLQVLEWSQEDPFWKNNIKSGYKFREKYETLVKQMKEKGVGCFSDDPYPSITKKLVKEYSYLVNNKKFNPSPSQYAKFVEASKKLKKFFEKRYSDMSEDERIKALSGCLEKNYIDRGEVLYPGHFCSDNTWNILLPQYLTELGID